MNANDPEPEGLQKVAQEGAADSPPPASSPDQSAGTESGAGLDSGHVVDDAAGDPAVRLAELAARAATSRLQPSDEEEAISLLKGLLTSGGHSLAPALAALPSLNWNVAASAVTAAWPDMSHTARDSFITGLKREDQRTESARRIRLSLARGLFKQDVEVAAKIIGAVCAELKKSAGEEPLSKAERRNFDAVMIGKGRPWICQLPLAEWRPAESAAVLQVAIAACFAGGNVPPFTQLSLLKWIADAERLDKLPEDSLQLVVDGVARWSPKWKAALRKEITTLPEALAVLVAGAESAAAPTATGDADSADESVASEDTEDKDSDQDEEEDDSAEEDEDDEEEVAVAESAEPNENEADAATPAPGRRMTRRERGRLRRLGKSVAQAAAADANGAGGDGEESGRRDKSGARFDVREALRQIERQYSQLKTELEVARSNLRQRDEAGGKTGRGRRGRAAEPEEAPLPESEVAALRQHNARLEETVAELRARVEELTGAAEDEATSREAFSDGQAPGERAQFQALIGLRLAQAKSDFDALLGRERDDVFDENYKTLLDRVFNLLGENGVTFPKVERPTEQHMQSM